MKLGIMQPYFLPYIGYWQLMNAVDQYVIYDDVNYIKGGWVNRNRLLLNGEPKYFNLPLLGASPNKKINEVNVNLDFRVLNKTLKMIQAAYHKAPYFETVYPLIEESMQSPKPVLSDFLTDTFGIICSYLRITTHLVISSRLEKDGSLKGQEKVLNICSLLKADKYYNAIGGQQLYSREAFREKCIELKFLKTNEIEYQQFSNEFRPNLSILDVMMFNSQDRVIEMLNEYTLI